MAFNKIENKEIKLIIVGKKNHGYKNVIKLIEKSDNIYYLDYIESELLLWLYKNAKLFVFPSFYEGFGFPPLEAAALGTVSVVSNVSSMPEICSDSSFYFDPFNVNEIIEVLNDLLKSEDKIYEKNKILKNNLNRYSWKRNAEETLRLYNSVGTSPSNCF